MDNDQAKSIFREGRPADDPLAVEALAHLQRDPALARWLAEERALDTAIAGKLRSITAPAGLRAAILAGTPEAARPARSSRRSAFTLAALIFLLLGCAAVWLPILTAHPDSLASFQSEMGAILTDGFRFQYQSALLPALQGWLAEKHGITHYRVPPALAAQTRPTGCRVFDWNGKKVALLCFYTADGQVVHLTMIARADLHDAPTSPQPRYAHRGTWTSATWTSGDTVYFVMSPLSEATLRVLL